MESKLQKYTIGIMGGLAGLAGLALSVGLCGFMASSLTFRLVERLIVCMV
jgi:hypothetical protein